MIWAGSEPFEPEAHPGCECTSCTPTCAADGCFSLDVTARAVIIDGTFSAAARVLLCDDHGRARPDWPTWKSSIPYPIPQPPGVTHG